MDSRGRPSPEVTCEGGQTVDTGLLLEELIIELLHSYIVRQFP